MILFVITLSVPVIPEVLGKKEGQRNTFLVKSNIQKQKLNVFLLSTDHILGFSLHGSLHNVLNSSQGFSNLKPVLVLIYYLY